MPKITEIKNRRGYAADWISINPVLGAGEMGLERDTNRIKFGDGVLTWTQLPYFSGGGGPFIDSPHYVSPRFGRFWYNALQTKTKPVVALIGDSITKKFNASSIANSWAGKVTSSLQNDYGDGGTGFRGMADFGPNFLSGFHDQYSLNDKVVSNSLTWTLSTNTLYQYDGPGFTMGSTTQAFANLEWNGIRGTTVCVYILGLVGSTGGTYKVEIDGVQVGGTFTTTSKGADAPYRQVVTTTAIAGPKKIVVTLLTGGINVFGISGENATGLVANTFARGGMRTNDTVQGQNYGGKWNGGSSYPCDLAIIALGVNDAPDADSMASVTGDGQRKMLHTIRAGGSKCDVLFVSQHIGSRDYEFRYHDIIARQREIAQAYDGALINMWARYDNDYVEATAWDYWGHTSTIGIPGSDSVHPSNAGHQLIANEVIPLVNP